MKGKRPIIDTEASVAMAAYITWFSEGLPITLNSKKPVNPYFKKVWPNKKTNQLVKKATTKIILTVKKFIWTNAATAMAKTVLERKTDRRFGDQIHITQAQA